VAWGTRCLGSVDPLDPTYRRAKFCAGRQRGSQPTAAHFFTDGPRPAESGENFVGTEIFHGRVRERALGVFKFWFSCTCASARPSTRMRDNIWGAYRSRATFEAVRGRGMMSALEPAGAVQLSMRYWRFISGRRQYAVDRLAGTRSRRHQVFVSSCFGTALDAMRRGSGRLGGVEEPHHASVGLGRVDGVKF